jgi:hypothetical protein
MQTKLLVAALTSGLFLAPIANAWVTPNEVQILRLIQFESGIGRDYTIIEFSGSVRCRVQHSDKELLSLTMMLYATGKSVSAVCYDTLDDPGGSGYPSYKLHRITGS